MPSGSATAHLFYDGSWSGQTAPDYGADFFDYTGLQETVS
jgi:hypothetical protein